MQAPWWFPALTALIGTVVGFLLLQSKDWWTRRQRHKAHWGALRAELEFCRRFAETYEDHKVAAPLYRLPTIFYRNSLPALLGDGAVVEADAEPIIAFFCEVETVNRGLDLADAARGDDPKLAAEVTRNLLKTPRLRPPKPGEDQGDNYYIKARAVLDKHLPRH